VFCFGGPELAKAFGSGTYMVFPVGEFKYVWNPDVEDLYYSMNAGPYSAKEEADKWVNGDKYNKPYQDTGIIDALREKNKEIMVKCVAYYAINYYNIKQDPAFEKEMMSI
jgi:hypothetical protein